MTRRDAEGLVFMIWPVSSIQPPSTATLSMTIRFVCRSYRVVMISPLPASEVRSR
jgi:hypothetical protein